MRGNYVTLLMIIAIILVVDIYVFQAVRLFGEEWSLLKKRIIYALFWTTTAVMISVFISAFFLGSPSDLPKWFQVGVVAPLFILFMTKMLVVVFLLIDDLRRLLGWVIEYFTSNEPYDLSLIHI